MSKCPAIMLAVNRTHNVMGRIRFLVISIITMNGMRYEGVLWGTKWESIFFVIFNHPRKLTDNHIIMERGKVIHRWEVNENTWGYNAVRFINIKIIKTVSRKISCLFLFLAEKLISFFISWKIFCLIFRLDLVLCHLSTKRNKIKIIIFRQGLIIIVFVGSKIEKRFDIMLSFDSISRKICLFFLFFFEFFD